MLSWNKGFILIFGHIFVWKVLNFLPIALLRFYITCTESLGILVTYYIYSGSFRATRKSLYFRKNSGDKNALWASGNFHVLPAENQASTYKKQNGETWSDLPFLKGSVWITRTQNNRKQDWKPVQDHEQIIAVFVMIWIHHLSIFRFDIFLQVVQVSSSLFSKNQKNFATALGAKSRYYLVQTRHNTLVHKSYKIDKAQIQTKGVVYYFGRNKK